MALIEGFTRSWRFHRLGVVSKEAVQKSQSAALSLELQNCSWQVLFMYFRPQRSALFVYLEPWGSSSGSKLRHLNQMKCVVMRSARCMTSTKRSWGLY